MKVKKQVTNDIMVDLCDICGNEYEKGVCDDGCWGCGREICKDCYTYTNIYDDDYGQDICINCYPTISILILELENLREKIWEEHRRLSDEYDIIKRGD